MDIKKIYIEHCQEYGIRYSDVSSALSYDATTLFCPAGMQRFKSRFSDVDYCNHTEANIQPCIRLNDLDSLGDGSHLAYFNMMGLFSFRHWTVKQAIDFWISYLNKIGITPNWVTIHPDKPDWKQWHSVEVRLDDQCKWSDGQIGGYCTEFYWKGVEIGNIVNPLETCIDVGFGFERLNILVNGLTAPSEKESLISCIDKIIESGVIPSNVQHGYVLRQLMRRLLKIGGSIDHMFFGLEVKRGEKNRAKYERLKVKNVDKTLEWWWETHGIDIKEVT